MQNLTTPTPNGYHVNLGGGCRRCLSKLDSENRLKIAETFCMLHQGFAQLTENGS